MSVNKGQYLFFLSTHLSRPGVLVVTEGPATVPQPPPSSPPGQTVTASVKNYEQIKKEIPTISDM